MAEVPNWVAAGLPPKVLAQGYDRSYADAVHMTEMEAGNFKTRLKTIMAAEPVQAQILVDRAGIARFRTFFRETTLFGSLPFWIPDQVFHGAPLLTASGEVLTTAAGVPLKASAHWLAMFRPGATPREGENQGMWFRINFSLLVLP